jgi:hypothetical protein
VLSLTPRPAACWCRSLADDPYALAIATRSELLKRFLSSSPIGSGQIVSQLEIDRRLYGDVLARCPDEDSALIARMRTYGEPPYNDVFPQAFVTQQYGALYRPYEPPAAYIQRGTAANLGPWGVLSEYSSIEKSTCCVGHWR